jgi:hypothetical protein
LRGLAPAQIDVEAGRAGSGLSKILGSPDRLVVASALECLGGTASVSELLAVTGLASNKVRTVLSDLEFWNLLVRTHADECRADITANGRGVLAEHWRALGSLRLELCGRKGELGSGS